MPSRKENARSLFPGFAGLDKAAVVYQRRLQMWMLFQPEEWAHRAIHAEAEQVGEGLINIIPLLAE